MGQLKDEKKNLKQTLAFESGVVIFMLYGFGLTDYCLFNRPLRCRDKRCDCHRVSSSTSRRLNATQSSGCTPRKALIIIFKTQRDEVLPPCMEGASLLMYFNCRVNSRPFTVILAMYMRLGTAVKTF